MSRRMRVLLCLAMAIAGSIQVGAAFSRSLIAQDIDGELTLVRSIDGSRGGLWQVAIDGRVYEVDNRRVAEIGRGRDVETQAWSSTLRVDGRPAVRLTVGDETFQFAALTVLSVGALWLFSGRRQDERRARGRGEPAA